MIRSCERLIVLLKITQFESLQSIRWMMMGAILVNSILKLTVLHNSTYQNLFSFFPSLHLVASTVTEHAVFVSAVFLGKDVVDRCF